MYSLVRYCWAPKWKLCHSRGHAAFRFLKYTARLFCYKQRCWKWSKKHLTDILRGYPNLLCDIFIEKRQWDPRQHVVSSRARQRHTINGLSLQLEDTREDININVLVAPTHNNGHSRRTPISVYTWQEVGGRPQTDISSVVSVQSREWVAITKELKKALKINLHMTKGDWTTKDIPAGEIHLGCGSSSAVPRVVSRIAGIPRHRIPRSFPHRTPPTCTQDTTLLQLPH